MRLRVNIPQVDPTVMDAPEVCPYEGCDGEYFKPHQQHCEKPLRDPEYDQVNAMRWKCLQCGRTHRVYPEGVSDAERSDRLKAAGVMLYLLGISYRGVEDFLTAFGSPVDHVTVYRDVQEAGEKARELREEWLKQAGRVRVVGGDPTHARCGGEDVIIGVVVDAQAGFILTIEVLDNEQVETLYQWLQPIVDLVDAEVLTTDDADAFKAVADRAGVEHQICRRHVTTNVLDFIAEAAEEMWEAPPDVPEELEISADDVLEDLEQLEWTIIGHPEHGSKVLRDLYFHYSAAPRPGKGEQASIWYRTRNHILHLWNNWKRLTCYLDLKHREDLEIDATNNAAERAIGWAVKERYRTMRGYKRRESILNVTGLTAWLIDQPPGYDMSPLFCS
jgi:transposase-like protein